MTKKKAARTQHLTVWRVSPEIIAALDKAAGKGNRSEWILRVLCDALGKPELLETRKPRGRPRKDAE